MYKMDMSIERLKQYTIIEREMKTLENRISKLSIRKYKFGVDTVSYSLNREPYTKRNITISGYGYDATDDNRKHKLIKHIKERLQTLNDEFDEITAFIESIDDSEIRQIIDYRYIDGLSWNMTATKIYGYPCGDRARKKLERF